MPDYSNEPPLSRVEYLLSQGGSGGGGGGASSADVAVLKNQMATLLADASTPGSIAKTVSDAINNLVNSAPGTMDTLGEIANFISDNQEAIAALQNDHDDIVTLKTQVATLNGTAQTTGSVAKAVSDAVDGLVGEAPSNLNTLEEIAAMLADLKEAMYWTKYTAG